MAGNLTGNRRYYLYTSDTGQQYSYLTDEDLGTAVGAVLNDTNPAFPRRFKPRGVYCQAEVGGKVVRKFLICPALDNAIYDSNTAQTVTIDTIDFVTTGRVGEQVSFGANPVVGP